MALGCSPRWALSPLACAVCFGTQYQNCLESLDSRIVHAREFTVRRGNRIGKLVRVVKIRVLRRSSAEAPGPRTTVGHGVPRDESRKRSYGCNRSEPGN